MKQLIVNQLDGGFVVQQIVDGQNQGPGVIRTNYGQVIKEGRKFFALEDANPEQEQPQEVVFKDEDPGVDADYQEREIPVPKLGRGRPRKAVSIPD